MRSFHQRNESTDEDIYGVGVSTKEAYVAGKLVSTLVHHKLADLIVDKLMERVGPAIEAVLKEQETE